VCGLIFLTVKLSYEWPAKFNHFGVFIKKEEASKYEEFLGNNQNAMCSRILKREIWEAFVRDLKVMP
jgi:hypothetical protein